MRAEIGALNPVPADTPRKFNVEIKSSLHVDSTLKNSIDLKIEITRRLDAELKYNFNVEY